MPNEFVGSDLFLAPTTARDVQTNPADAHYRGGQADVRITLVSTPISRRDIDNNNNNNDNVTRRLYVYCKRDTSLAASIVGRLISYGRARRNRPGGGVGGDGG